MRLASEFHKGHVACSRRYFANNESKTIVPNPQKSGPQKRFCFEWIHGWPATNFDLSPSSSAKAVPRPYHLIMNWKFWRQFAVPETHLLPRETGRRWIECDSASKQFKLGSMCKHQSDGGCAGFEFTETYFKNIKLRLCGIFFIP